MTPSWYDLLDVDATADPDEIRAAWKTAIAELDPGDRRFRVFNQAAEVLLDPDRRAAYDVELAAQAPDEPEPAPFGPGADDPSADRVKPRPEPVGMHSVIESTRGPRRVVPGWLLVVVGAIAAIVVGGCAVLAITQPSDASIAEATREAQSSAERAIVPILSYDAAHLDDDQRAAEGFMTADYRKEYDKLFEVIKANAPQTKTVVSAQVIASGVVRSGEDRVSVLIFVNRPTTNKQVKEPVVYKDQVTVTMQKVGSDWLVDNMVTSPAAG